VSRALKILFIKDIGMDILVTGHDGFIGSYLVNELEKLGHSVRGLSAKSGDVRNKTDVDKSVREVQFIFHLAAQTSVPKSFENPQHDYEVNFLGTKNIIEACRKFGSKLVFVSSAAVYGNPAEIPLREDSPKLPESFYGLHKYLAESLCDEGAFIIRPANVYGLKGNSVINTFTRNVLQKKPVTFFNDGSHTRDYVHVSDVVKALLLGLKHRGIFNIGSGAETSLDQVTGIIEKETGLKAEREFKKTENDVKRSCLDISKARKELGWKPAVSLPEGIKEIINHESLP
jgi:UDP-glucose 4-epimerase